MFNCCSNEDTEALTTTEALDQAKTTGPDTEEVPAVIEAAKEEPAAPAAEPVEQAKEAKDLAPAVEPAEAAPAPAPAQQSAGQVYSVTLDKSGGGKLGAVIDIHMKDFAVVIKTHPGGIIDAWNKSCAPDKVIQTGDRLLSVGGTGGDNQSLVTMLTSSASAQVQFQRPVEVEVSLPASDRKVGLRLPITGSVENVLGCEILSVVPDSRMSDWNDKADPTQVIKPDDRLFKVNGERVDGQAIQQALQAKASSALTLTFFSWR